MKQFLRSAGDSLHWILGSQRGAELPTSWRDTESGVRDPSPVLQRVYSLVSIISTVMITIVLITVLIELKQACLPAVLPPAEPCPEDWIYYQRRCYFFSENEADWARSEDFCSSQGACLILIDDKKEMNFITTQMWAPSVWIGLHKNEREIQWLNGSAFNNQLFELHGKGECVYIQSKMAYLSSCTVPKNWVCRKEPY
ncbi:C-type lectin domain family 2 member L-like [Rhinatrema bivittatum]|uniref:C-type lectin domain family 2 member L-like n=1 Tax=Rhinatrema bivittatum TaxID=194408 RepID=UPI0011295199|nr:C-type lectin domain family 2 member L-like [Rhinatrema bivittatum]